MEISIIIPAYNCKKTLDTALSSIANQIIDVNFEVIIVNDSSDYKYTSFINKYKKTINIKEIDNKENMGPGYSRQYGIDNSNSKYIVFLDSDDCFYDVYSLSKLYNSINNYDVVISNFIYQRDNKEIIKKKDPIFLHGKIYRRSFLKENKIRFNNSRSNEDNGFNRLILLLNPRVCFLDEITYVYKENSESITRKNNREYKFNGLEGYCFNANWVMEELIKRNKDFNYFKNYLLIVMISIYYYYIDFTKRSDVNKIIEWSKCIKEKYDLIKNNITKDKINEWLIKEKDFLKDDIKTNKCIISFDEFLEKY